jgi:hypothetical protein
MERCGILKEYQMLREDQLLRNSISEIVILSYHLFIKTEIKRRETGDKQEKKRNRKRNGR